MLYDKISNEPTPEDDSSAFVADQLCLVIEIQASVLIGIDMLFDRYIEICGCSSLPATQWHNKESFRKKALSLGLGFKNMKVNDIINQAMVAGGLEIAKFQAEAEKELGITESE